MRHAQHIPSTHALPPSAHGRWIPCLLATATALLTVAPSFWDALWPLAWVALLPLVLALRAVAPRRAFLLGWWAETLIYWVGFYWLIGTLMRFGELSVPVSVLCFAVIGLGNGVRLGLFAWWLRRTASAARSWWAHMLLPACEYVTLDYLFPRVFPWYLGFLQRPALPLIQIADITGIHGLTFLLVVCSTLAAAWVPHATQPARTTRRLMSLGVAGLLLLQGSYGLWRMRQITAAMQHAPSLRLALIQPNLGIDEQRRSLARDAQLDTQQALSAPTLDQHPDLVIWPESMYPFEVPASLSQLPWPSRRHAQHTHWLIGALTSTGQGSTRQVFNAALLLAPDGRRLGHYEKQQLLAFGEYLPLQRFLPFLRHLSPAIGDLTPGVGGIMTLPNGIGIGPLMCYEDILPALGRQAVRQGAQVLVNLTNDVWFGLTRAPYQHRALAAFRAVEHRVYLVRVTNTGLTSIIDALGQERATLPLFQADTLVQIIQPLRLSTVYTRFGDWFAQLCSALALLLSLWSWHRQAPTHSQTRAAGQEP